MQHRQLKKKNPADMAFGEQKNKNKKDVFAQVLIKHVDLKDENQNVLNLYVCEWKLSTLELQEH